MDNNGVFLIIIGLIIFAIIFIFLIYNSLIAKRNNVEYAFSGIDVQLKKRCDLIPNLVSAVKNYMKHESETLTKIAELRSKAMSPNISHDEKNQILNEMSGSFRTIMVQAENYPDLKASTNFMHLQGTLNEVEEQLSASRRAYNATILEYNNACEMFPSSIFASIFGFRRKEMFMIPEAERANPNLNNLFGN